MRCPNCKCELELHIKEEEVDIPINIIWDVETTGLNPAIDKIIAIGITYGEHSTDPFILCGDDEHYLLTEFYKQVQYASSLVGFNIIQFDIPFLIARSFVNNIKVPSSFLKCPIVDLREILGQGNPRPMGKLWEYAKAIGCEVKTDNGFLMPELYAKQNWESIKSHLIEDVILTKAVYIRLREVGLIGIPNNSLND